MIKAFIFDFAGVITTTDPYWQWIREKNLEEKRAVFQRLSEDVDRAYITHEQFLTAFAKEMGTPKETVWPEIKARNILNQELIALIIELKKKYKIGLLSNFTYPWISELLEEYDLRQYFDELLISSQEKMIKPDPQFFYKMLERLDVEPQEAVFADDKQSNVDGAKKLGIHAFLFTTTEQFKKDLDILKGVYGK
jgi:epoxide hydrolase-like predicted phosphatase